MKRTKKVILQYEAITKNESNALKIISERLDAMILDYEQSMDFLKTKELSISEANFFTKQLRKLLKGDKHD